MKQNLFSGLLPPLLAFGLMVTASPVALSHGTETHDNGITVQAESAAVDSNLPIDLGGEFELIDHHGNLVTDQSYQGKHMLVFFGYASCKNMCSITLTRIGKALEILGDDVDKLSPVVITVDPERDTPQVMKSELVKYHPDLIGHTGNSEQLLGAYSNYKQTPKSAGVDWNGDPIVSHSSYIYLMSPTGDLTTFFPPILNPQSMADIIGKYINGAS